MVGITEQEAKNKMITQLLTNSRLLQAKALIEAAIDGFIKIITDNK